jgi:hypothetical protein
VFTREPECCGERPRWMVVEQEQQDIAGQTKLPDLATLGRAQ